MNDIKAWIIQEVEAVLGIAARGAWMGAIAALNQNFGWHIDPMYVQAVLFAGILHKAVKG